MNNFLLCPNNQIAEEKCNNINLNISFKTEEYALFSRNENIQTINGLGVFIDGYILPRSDNYSKNSKLDQHNLVSSLFLEHEHNFTNHIKGVFIIILFYGKNVYIITDHLGVYRVFYFIHKGQLFVSSSINTLKEAGVRISFDETSLAMQSLFHRVPVKNTIFRNIFKNTYGTKIIANQNVNVSSYWRPEDLLNQNENLQRKDYFYFADKILELIKNFNAFLNPSGNLITLTGGKDSRTILAGLLNSGIKPVTFTYGNDRSCDSIYSKLVAEAVELEHKILNPAANREWFEEKAWQITNFGNPDLNIHRSHRLFSFHELSLNSNPETAVYAGYLGGELMMGIFYDNLIYTNFLTRFWDDNKKPGIEERLKIYFHKDPSGVVDGLKERIIELKCTDPGLDSDMQTFHSIFEIGIPHYSQDINLMNIYWSYPYPLFLDIDFLESLFQSRFSFMGKGTKSINPLKRYSLFELNMNLQHILYPGLDNIPFGKKGTYTIKEYLNGSVYWSIIKSVRFLSESRKFPPSFVYLDSYREFLLDYYRDIESNRSSLINHLFLIQDAKVNLKTARFPASESQLHRYSNIIMFYLFEKALANEN